MLENTETIKWQLMLMVNLALQSTGEWVSGLACGEQSWLC